MSIQAEEIHAIPRSEAVPAREPRDAWRICFWSVVGVAICSSPVAFITVSLFIKPFGVHYGWDRAAVSLAISIGALALAVSTPMAGRLIDRFGVRPVLISSLLSYGAALAAVPWLIDLGGLYGLYAAYALVGILSAGSNTVAYARLLAGWFDRSRGFALGIGMSGIPLGMAITPPFTQYLIDNTGWTGAFIGLGCLPIVVGIPIALFALREAAERPKTSTDPGAPLPGLTLAEAMRGRTFWTLLVVFALLAGAMTGIELHLVPLMSDRGFTPMVAALCLSLVNVVAIGARVGAGYLFDRTFAPRVGAVLFALAMLACILLMSFDAPVLAYAAAVLLGFGIGAESDLLAYLIGKYFGVRAYAELFGWIFGAFMVGVAVGPYAVGLAFEAYGSYLVPLGCAAVALALSCLMLVSLPRYAPATPSGNSPG